MMDYKNHVNLTNEQKEMMKLMGYKEGTGFPAFSKVVSNNSNTLLELSLTVNPYGVDVPAIIYADMYESSQDDFNEVYVPIKTILREIKILKSIGVNIDIEEIEGI